MQEQAGGTDLTGCVVQTTPYLTVHLVSVILTEIDRVVVIFGGEIVVTQKNIVLVVTALTS